MTERQRFFATSRTCGETVKGTALIDVDAALGRIDRAAEPVAGTEFLDLAAVHGRVLAEPVRAVCMTPPFDNAAMDGYAFDSRALTGDGPWSLAVCDRLPAGTPGHRMLGPLQAVHVFTGAPIPHGADTVVMQEAIRRSGATIQIEWRPDPGLNIRTAGSDLLAGQTVLESGSRLGPREIAVAAAAGAGSLSVRRRLRIALLVTGDEVRRTGEARGSAQIWDINTPMLTAALDGPATDLVSIEHCADNRNGMSRQLADLAARADLVVTTGGVSVGEEDHVKSALAALGAQILFSGVAIKPGKPVSFGRVGVAKWLGLPGNPLSCFVTWQVFGTALVRRLSGQTARSAPRRHVVTAEAIRRKPGRCELRPATVTGFDPQGREVVRFEDATHSGRVGSLPSADGLMFLPAEVDHVPAGALLEFQPFCEA